MDLSAIHSISGILEKEITASTTPSDVMVGHFQSMLNTAPLLEDKAIASLQAVQHKTTAPVMQEIQELSNNPNLDMPHMLNLQYLTVKMVVNVEVASKIGGNTNQAMQKLTSGQ